MRSSSDGKTVAANFGYLSLLQIAGYVFPLITMPYLARTIGADGFGKIAFAAAIIAWMQTITGWGFAYTATRDVAQNRNNKDVVSEIFSNTFWARCFLATISLVILLILIVIVPSFKNAALIILITYLTVPSHILFPEWLFQALERMKYITIFNFIIKLIFTVAVFIFIKTPDDYFLQPLLTSIGYVICGVCSLWLIIYKWGYRLNKPNFNAILSTIKSSTDVFINNLMPNLYNSFSVMLLGVFGVPSATGIFDGGNKFVTMSEQIFQVLSKAFFPFLSRKIDHHKTFARLNITLSLVIAFLLAIFAPLIVKVMLGPEFSDSVRILQILAISLFFMALSNTYGTNYLIIIRKERELRRITMVVSVFGMLIAIPLVYYLSYWGAAITILSSRAILGISIFLYAKHIQRQKLSNSQC